jgi:alkylhydroperoxidase/carboxymuconolactone decarboxylase family protein YurZ
MTTAEGAVAARAEIRAAYRDLLGAVPTGVADKFEVFDGDLTDTIMTIEQARARALTPKVLDPKAVQLLQFGIYVALGSKQGAKVHAAAARRYGAAATNSPRPQGWLSSQPVFRRSAPAFSGGVCAGDQVAAASPAGRPQPIPVARMWSGLLAPAGRRQ